MILVDANILMYAAGSDHPCKAASVRFLEGIARGNIAAAVDTEVLQEILHRYRALDRWGDGRLVYDAARRIFPEVIPITVEILDKARSMLDGHQDLMARDALHASVVLHHNMEAICTFDRDFDRIVEIRRVQPE